ncbi:MAG TPA: glycosyl transferase family 90 [Rhizobiaceae bacterium]|nr:glycosyl transferase family 90 [Rhizobiaceae bacterium]
MSDFCRTAQRVAYYARNFARDTAPQIVFRRRLHGLLATLGKGRESVISDRLAYYNKLEDAFTVSPAAVAIGRLPLKKSCYYYDLKEHARYFDRRLRFDYLFGDVAHIPPVPTLLKSRPTAGDNSNSVLMNLDKLRHFRRVADPVPFEKKRSMAVWRGAANHPRRTPFVENCIGLAACDVGFTHGGKAEHRRPYMTIGEQLAYRYVISIEGYDVATNLKWIMASQSLCIMPEPSCETWFMEGRLQPDVHFVAVKPDLSDLEEKIDRFESAPREALSIVANANAHVRRFSNPEEEQLTSLLVLYKYFVLSGQLEPDGEIGRRFERHFC